MIRDEIIKNKANLCGADLCGTDLYEADLHEANLYEANLHGANLRKANLGKANLREANLHGANLYEANLCGANLHEADLHEANLYEADLCGADFCGANLCEANLCRTDLREANLHGANLCEANLYEANLRKANLGKANLCRANLCRTDLHEVDLYEAKNIPLQFRSDLNILKYQQSKLIAFKYLNKDISPYQNFRYEIEKEYFCENGNSDDRVLCSIGINLASLEWCLRETNCDLLKTYAIFEFDSIDILSIPYNSDGKFRVRRAKYIRNLTEDEIKQAIRPLYEE